MKNLKSLKEAVIAVLVDRLDEQDPPGFEGTGAKKMSKSPSSFKYIKGGADDAIKAAASSRMGRSSVIQAGKLAAKAGPLAARAAGPLGGVFLAGDILAGAEELGLLPEIPKGADPSGRVRRMKTLTTAPERSMTPKRITPKDVSDYAKTFSSKNALPKPKTKPTPTTYTTAKPQPKPKVKPTPTPTTYTTAKPQPKPETVTKKDQKKPDATRVPKLPNLDTSKEDKEAPDTGMGRQVKPPMSKGTQGPRSAEGKGKTRYVGSYFDSRKNTTGYK